MFFTDADDTKFDPNMTKISNQVGHIETVI